MQGVFGFLPSRTDRFVFPIFALQKKEIHLLPGFEPSTRPADDAIMSGS